ncbi:hypothetical protein ACPCI0_19655 [Streptomyces griseoincarnatus]
MADMVARTPRNGGPRLVTTTGRGPAVRAVHRIVLDADRGILTAGNLWAQYRPCPPGASVVLDCRSYDVMQADTARQLGHCLALCREITVTGTAERSERGYVDDYGLIFGLDAIANAIERFAHDPATEHRK